MIIPTECVASKSCMSPSVSWEAHVLATFVGLSDELERLHVAYIEMLSDPYGPADRQILATCATSSKSVSASTVTVMPEPRRSGAPFLAGR